MGAACDVPAPTASCWLKTIFTPVNGSATADTSGARRRRLLSRSIDRALCHAGRPNNADTPPLVPCDSGESTQACSPIHPPFWSVERVVPPTDVIAGRDDTASSPMSSGPGGDDHSSPPLHSRPAVAPLASKAEVPCLCAVASAASTGARSGALTSESQPQPIDRLHTAPGNCRSTDSNNCPIFSYAPSPSTVGRALTTTFCASGAIACATSRSITVSAPDGPGWPPTNTGVNLGKPDVSANLSRSAWSYPLNSKNTIVVPL